MNAWKTSYRRARIQNRSVQDRASRLALNVCDACRYARANYSGTIGFAAAWLRTAGDIRKAGGRREDVRLLIQHARNVRLGLVASPR
jgi:hypothetical protein